MEQPNQSNLFSELTFDHTARQTIRSLAGWATVLVVIAVSGYLINLFDLLKAPKVDPDMEQFNTRFLSKTAERFWTILFIIIGLAINFFLFRFATLAKAGVDGYDQQKLSGSFNYLKGFFMSMSILLIIVFVICLLFITFMAVVGPDAVR